MAFPASSVVGTYLFGKETSYGLGGTANKDIGLVQSANPIAPDGNIAQYAGGGQAKSVSIKNGIVTPKGTLDLIYQHGRVLEWALFGGTSTHVDTSSDCTHTLVWANLLPSLAYEFAYEMGTTDVGAIGVGLVFGTTTVNSNSLDGVVTVNGGWNAKSIDISDTTASAAVVNAGSALGGFECTATVAGVAVDYVQSWSLTMNANTKTAHGGGSRVPQYAQSHSREVSYSIKALFDSVTQVNKFLGGTTISATEPAGFAVSLAADNGVALGSGKRNITLGLTSCQHKPTVTAAKNDFVAVTLDGMGILSTGSAVDQVLLATW